MLRARGMDADLFKGTDPSAPKLRFSQIDLAVRHLDIPMSRFVVRWGEIRPRLDPWDTLDDLREIIRHRCTPAHFEAAVTVMGNDPYSVASYLCRHGHITLQAEPKAILDDPVEEARSMDQPILTDDLCECSGLI
jgi:hypothetical protein